MKGDFVMPDSWYEPPDEIPVAECEMKDCGELIPEDDSICANCFDEVWDDLREWVDTRVEFISFDTRPEWTKKLEWEAKIGYMEWRAFGGYVPIGEAVPRLPAIATAAAMGAQVASLNETRNNANQT